MIEVNKPFKLFANCIPVRGYNRSTLCDLQRNQAKLIPNDLYEILNKYEGFSVEEIKKEYSNEYDETITEYFVFLLENEFIFFTDIPKSFPKLSSEWDSPSKITNAIIDFDNDSNYNFDEIIRQLDDLNCQNIEIRFYCRVEKRLLEDILVCIEEQKSTIQTLDFTLPFSLDVESIESLIGQYNRISSIRVFDAPLNKFIPPIREKMGYVVYSEEKILNEGHCGVISRSFFAINIPTYTEGLNHNTCLNRKIGIDTKGNIKNCPSMNEVYGNVSNTKLKDAIEEKGFKKYWDVIKDEISICKDCEFRYICTDCRAFVSDSRDKPLKCGYNPYTNEWGNWKENKGENNKTLQRKVETEKP